MQVNPTAVNTMVQIVNTSNDVKKLYRIGCAAGSTKYPGLVAIGFWKVKESALAPATSDRLASSAFRRPGRLANMTTANTVLYLTSALNPNLSVPKRRPAMTAWKAKITKKNTYEIHFVPTVRCRICASR